MNRLLPLKGSNIRITQEYGRKNSMYRKGYHTGLDLVCDGDRNIYNVTSGVVLRSMYASGKGADPDGWGNYVIVRQVDDKDVLYAHLSKVSVTLGQTVIPGDKLGVMGATGNATGEHLHYEVFLNNYRDRVEMNPADYLGIKNMVGPIEKLGDGKFPDVPLEHWAFSAVEAVAEAGIMSGDPDGLFHGDRPATRYELASVAHRLMLMLKGGE